VSALAIDLRRTAGFLVADARGRVVGTVECPMYGTSPETPDALSVRSGWLARRRRQVVQVGLHRRLELVPPLDSLEPGMEQRGEGQVRVAGRIGTADLGTRR